MTIKIFIRLKLLSLSLFSCNMQTLPMEMSTTDPSALTPNMISTASVTPEATEVLPTIFSSPTFEVTEAVPTVVLSPIPNEVFFFGATPQVSQIGGIRGVYYRQDVPLVDESYVPDPRCVWIYDILRFYEDGLVMTVPICEAAANDVFDKVWPDTSQWFNRANNDPTLSRRTYYTTENQIWFTTTAENDTLVVDYFGTWSQDRMILDSYSHSNAHQSIQREFVFLDGSDTP